MQYQIHRAHRPQGSYPHNNPQDNDIDDDLEVNMALGAPDLASLLVYDYYPGKTYTNHGQIFVDLLDFKPCITYSFSRKLK